MATTGSLKRRPGSTIADRGDYLPGPAVSDDMFSQHGEIAKHGLILLLQRFTGQVFMCVAKDVLS